MSDRKPLNFSDPNAPYCDVQCRTCRGDPNRAPTHPDISDSSHVAYFKVVCACHKLTDAIDSVATDAVLMRYKIAQAHQTVHSLTQLADLHPLSKTPLDINEANRWTSEQLQPLRDRKN